MGTSNRRRQILVHSTQKKFAIGLGLTLFTYSLLLFTIAFFVPYFYPELKTLSASLPFLNSSWPAFWYISGILWPVLLTLIVITAFFSLFLTHKVAGPLYRLKACAKEIENGNVSIRVRLRKGDELQDLAESTDRGIVAINKAMSEIRHHNGHVQNSLQTLIEALRGRPSMDPAKLTQLEQTVGEAQQIKTILGQFQISDRNDSQVDGKGDSADTNSSSGPRTGSEKNETSSPEYASSISTIGG